METCSVSTGGSLISCRPCWSSTNKHVTEVLVSSETTCQRKNPYEDEHIRILEEFDQKYGLFGEGLETPEEKEENKETGAHMIHFPSELPEYADIEEKYRAEDENLKEYREQCKDEAFKLFSKWFFHLWD